MWFHDTFAVGPLEQLCNTKFYPVDNLIGLASERKLL